MAEDDRVTILLVGVTGSGKSSLGNVLLGKNHKTGPFGVGGSTRSVTENIQEETSNAFAGKEGRLIRIIDVPGHGDSEGRDKDFEEKMVKKWEELEKVDGIIAVYNFSNPRLSQQDKSLFWSLCKAFGPGFLKHIIINVSRYKHSEEAEEEREEEGRSLEKFKEEVEEFLTKGISALFKNSSLTAPFLAIDALYRERDRRQKEMFVRGTDKLWQHLEKEHEVGGLLSLKYIRRRISEIGNELKKRHLSSNEREDLNEELKRLKEAKKGQTKLSFTEWIALATLLGMGGTCVALGGAGVAVAIASLGADFVAAAGLGIVGGVASPVGLSIGISALPQVIMSLEERKRNAASGSTEASVCEFLIEVLTSTYDLMQWLE